jgi:hypothetical protein
MSNANEKERAKARERFEASQNALNRSAQMQIANMPTAEMKEFEAYKNKVRQSDRSMQYKTERELFIQFQKDKYAGYAASNALKVDSAGDIQTSKNKADDMRLKSYAKKIAEAKTTEERIKLQRQKDIYEQETYGGIGQGAGGGSGRFPDRSSAPTVSNF